MSLKTTWFDTEDNTISCLHSLENVSYTVAEI